MSMTPSGWYPSPGEPGWQRYWDGSAWTETRAPLYAAPYPPLVGAAWVETGPQALDKASHHRYRRNVAVVVVVIVFVTMSAAAIGTAVSRHRSSKSAIADVCLAAHVLQGTIQTYAKLDSSFAAQLGGAISNQYSFFKVSADNLAFSVQPLRADAEVVADDMLHADYADLGQDLADVLSRCPAGP